MYERDLQALIRGLRSDAAKRNEAQYIAQVTAEIRQEIMSDDMHVKAGAVCKLTYLDMLGHDMRWASFNVIEVMSSPHAALKSTGYLAAAMCFDQSTDVLMLTTNLVKKDLSSGVIADMSTSLNSLSHFITPSLARDLAPDLIPMLTHSRALVRKRAILVLYKLFVHYPEALMEDNHSRGGFYTRLCEKLEDPDIGVVSATVNVLCELSRRDPKHFLSLAPRLFHLLTTSTNNWMLIKIVKLFGAMTPHEPRLIKKLQPPLTELISTTPAVSLLYECVHTCIIGGMFQASNGRALAKTCVEKLAAFLDDPDQNLKYIALLALVKIVPTHAYLVAEHQESILASVNDADVSIRMRALDLVSAMVTRDSLQPIVQHLLSHLSNSDAAQPNALPSASQSLHRITGGGSSGLPNHRPLTTTYRLEVSTRILSMCSRDTYDNIEDFEWYISVLVDLAYVARAKLGQQIKEQLMDVCVRVRSVRTFAVGLMARLVEDTSFLEAARSGGEEQANSCVEVLWAAAWICGEYASDLLNPHALLSHLLSPLISDLLPDIRAVYIQAATKVLGTWMADLAVRWDDRGEGADHQVPQLASVRNDVDLVIELCKKWVSDSDIEVQERGTTLMNLLVFVRADLASHNKSLRLPSPSVSRSQSPLPQRIGTPTLHPASPKPPTAQLTFPKSLFLISPLSSVYGLNYVAQTPTNVRLPSGIDLDMWIVEESIVYGGDEDAEKPKAKKKKGKTSKFETFYDETAVPDVTQGKKKKKKRAEGNDREDSEHIPDVFTAVSETAQEDEIREKRRLERLERYRDDPYYIMDTPPAESTKRPKSKLAHDVDSIPVVRLEGLSLGPTTGVSKPTTNKKSKVFSSLPPSRGHTPRPDIDKGEVSLSQLSQSVPNRTASPAVPSPASSSVVVLAASENEGVSSPQPIQVVRVKKASKGKKKASAVS